MHPPAPAAPDRHFLRPGCIAGEADTAAIGMPYIISNNNATSGFAISCYELPVLEDGESEEIGVTIETASAAIKSVSAAGSESIKVSNLQELIEAWQVYEALICQIMFFKSIKNHLTEGGGSHGSFLVIDNNKGIVLHPKLINFKYKKDKHELQHMIQEITCINLQPLEFEHRWVHRRPLPTEESWFETEWARFEKKEIFNE